MNLFRTSLVGGALLLAIGGGWYSWHWYTTPQPPEIDLGSSGDPALPGGGGSPAGSLPGSARAAAWGRLGQIGGACLYRRSQAVPDPGRASRSDGCALALFARLGALLNHPEEAVPCFQRALQLAAADRPREAAAPARLRRRCWIAAISRPPRRESRPLLSSDFATLAHPGPRQCRAGQGRPAGGGDAPARQHRQSAKPSTRLHPAGCRLSPPG